MIPECQLFGTLGCHLCEVAESVLLPHGRGTNRAEAICALPPGLSAAKASWLVLYDAPGADRLDGAHTVFGDLLRRD